MTLPNNDNYWGSKFQNALDPPKPYFHMSYMLLDLARDITKKCLNPERGDLKPNHVLWLSCTSSEWKNFVITGLPSVYNYKYTVLLNDSKIYTVSNVQDFEDKYKFKKIGSVNDVRINRDKVRINWDKVRAELSSTHCGVQINPRQFAEFGRMLPLWLDVFDVCSVFLWDNRCIQSASCVYANDQLAMFHDIVDSCDVVSEHVLFRKVYQMINLDAMHDHTQYILKYILPSFVTDNKTKSKLEKICKFLQADFTNTLLQSNKSQTNNMQSRYEDNEDYEDYEDDEADGYYGMYREIAIKDIHSVSMNVINMLDVEDITWGAKLNGFMWDLFPELRVYMVSQFSYHQRKEYHAYIPDDPQMHVKQDPTAGKCGILRQSVTGKGAGGGRPASRSTRLCTKPLRSSTSSS